MRTVARNSRGYGLVDLLLSLALAVALFLGVSYVLQSQVAIVRKLKVKLEVTSLYLDLQRSLGVPENCLRNLRPPFSIDEYRISSPGYGVNLESLSEEGSPPLTLLAAGKKIETLSHEATVLGIRALNITKTGPSSFLLDIQAPVRGPDGKILSHLAFTRIQAKTDPDSPVAARRVVSCRYGGAAQIGLKDCRIASDLGSLHFPHFVLCGPDEAVVAGGGVCLGKKKEDVGFVSYSGPKLTSTLSGWEFDCRNSFVTDDQVQSQVVAYCCKR